MLTEAIMKKIISTFFGLLILAIGNLAIAGPVELVTNGDFETGTLAGWTVSTAGSPSTGININTGTYEPLGPSGTRAPIGGSYDAIFDQGGSGNASIFELLVTLPTTAVVSAIFSWDHVIENHHSSYFLPASEGGSGYGQMFRAQVTDSGGSSLLDVFTSTAANTTFGALASISTDLTGFVNANLGSTIGLKFENAATSYFITSQLDNVSFEIVTAVPEPGLLTLLVIGLAGLFGVRRKQYA